MLINIPATITTKRIKEDAIIQNKFNAFGFGVEFIGRFSNCSDWWEFSAKATNHLTIEGRNSQTPETRTIILTEISKMKKT